VQAERHAPAYDAVRAHVTTPQRGVAVVWSIATTPKRSGLVARIQKVDENLHWHPRVSTSFQLHFDRHGGALAAHQAMLNHHPIAAGS
jgi:hypothetical protein